MVVKREKKTSIRVQAEGAVVTLPCDLHNCMLIIASTFWESGCASVGRAGYELMMGRLSVQILPPTVHMSEVSMGKTLNPELFPMGPGSTLHGSSYPMVCECACEWANERPL